MRKGLFLALAWCFVFASLILWFAGGFLLSDPAINKLSDLISVTTIVCIFVFGLVVMYGVLRVPMIRILRWYGVIL